MDLSERSRDQRPALQQGGKSRPQSFTKINELANVGSHFRGENLRSSVVLYLAHFMALRLTMQSICTGRKLVSSALLVLSLTACGGSEPRVHSTPAQTVTSDERSRSSVEENGPTVDASATVEASADSPERTRVLGLLTPERIVYWRVLAEAGGGTAGCHRFRVQVSDAARSEAEPTGFLRGAGAHSWRFVVEADGIRISNPSISSGVSGGASAMCETRLAFAEFPHEDAASCENQAHTFEPGECGRALTSLTPQPDTERHLQRRLRRRGRVWVADEDDAGTPLCTPWTVRPSHMPEADAAGTLTRRERSGRTLSEETYDFRLNGHELMLLGPSSSRIVGGRRVEEGAMGDFDVTTVTEDRMDFAEVGGVRWYYSASACRDASASEEPLAPGSLFAEVTGPHASGPSVPPPPTPSLALTLTFDRQPSPGHIDASLVEERIQRRQRAMERCLERERPDSSSRMSAEFVIEESGTVREARALDAQTSECLVQTLRRIRHSPPPTGGTVRYRITFDVRVLAAP